MNRVGFAVVLLFLSAAPIDAAMTRAEARKLIAEQGLPETGEGMLAILNTSAEAAPRLVEAFLTLGIRADREITYQADGNQTLTRFPLTFLLMFSCRDDTTAAMARLLVDAGRRSCSTGPVRRPPSMSRCGTASPDASRCGLRSHCRRARTFVRPAP